MTDTQWGRKETIVRPPHYPVYSLGAVFISLIVTALCIYLHLAFVMSLYNATISPPMSKPASLARYARAASTNS